VKSCTVLAVQADGRQVTTVEGLEKDGKLEVRLDLPGVDPKDVEVSLDGTTITIGSQVRGWRFIPGYPSCRRSCQQGPTLKIAAACVFLSWLFTPICAISDSLGLE